MNKSDLKNGMVVETRCGNKYILIGDRFCRKEGFLELNDYRDDLTIRGSRIFDVMKVYNAHYKSLLRAFLDNELDLVWERFNWNSVKKGTEVFVRNSEYEKWRKRKFKGFDFYSDEPFITYPINQDSWELNKEFNKKSTGIRWKYCKLVEDKDEE